MTTQTDELDLATDIFVLALKGSRYLLNKFLELWIWCGFKIDSAIRTIGRWIQSLEGLQPSLSQYANRLIEYFDTDIVVSAYLRFADLVNSGVSPDHAFRMVTGYDN